jgi:Raf kinase inhibitor-like YbhB/YbcL family protein
MRNVIPRSLVVAAFLLAVNCGSDFAQQSNAPAQAPPSARPNVTPPMKLTIPEFPDGGTIPIRHTCSASTPPPSGPMHISLGVSPLIQWSNPPAGTQSFALILHDADAHIAKAFDDITHWAVFNIPGDATSLPEGVPPDNPLANGTLQGNNMMRRAAFQGPCAPPEHLFPHHYTFQLYALDKKLDLPQGASRDDIQKAMDGHILAGATYIGLFIQSAPPPAK